MIIIVELENLLDLLELIIWFDKNINNYRLEENINFLEFLRPECWHLEWVKKSGETELSQRFLFWAFVVLHQPDFLQPL